MQHIFKASLAFSLFCLATTGQIFAKGESKMVTRIDNATSELKGGKLTVHAEGMALTGASIVRSAKLVRRGELQPNKDGLVEYELQFYPPSKADDKLRSVKASITEHLSSGEVKGARVFAELNQMDAPLPGPKEKKKK